MERIKELNLYQKIILIIMIAMLLLFAAVYFRTISRVGFEYKDSILVPSQENGGTVYSGSIQWQDARFMVKDKTVIFQHGDKTYGPYTAREDPTAVPKDSELAEDMTGVEIRQGDEVLFRGGVWERGEELWLYHEDGRTADFTITYTTSDGLTRDENGNVLDPVKPSAGAILDLMRGPKLTHKGEWSAWVGALVLCILNGLFILFADELFRFHLAFQIRSVEGVEPSDLEIAGRYVSWTVLPVMALALLIIGLG